MEFFGTGGFCEWFWGIDITAIVEDEVIYIGRAGCREGIDERLFLAKDIFVTTMLDEEFLGGGSDVLVFFF